jgi:hypothetical protein
MPSSIMAAGGSPQSNSVPRAVWLSLKSYYHQGSNGSSAISFRGGEAIAAGLAAY